MVIYRKLKTQIMLTTATWLHTKLAAKIHRIEYGFEPRPMSQPLLMYCTSVSPGDFAHLSVILLIQQLWRAILRNFYEDFPCARWWLPSIYERSAWQTHTRWNNFASLCNPLWLYCVRWKLTGAPVCLLYWYNQVLQAMKLIALWCCWRPVLSKEKGTVKALSDSLALSYYSTV